MTDNEKRAHDLAVAASIDICKTDKEIQLANGAKEISVDYFKAYMGVYETAVELFNEKFNSRKIVFPSSIMFIVNGFLGVSHRLGSLFLFLLSHFPHLLMWVVKLIILSTYGYVNHFNQNILFILSCTTHFDVVYFYSRR